MSSANQTRWGELTVLWPYEQVALDLEVVTNRELTTLEWVLERILDAFPEQPPTLDEAATELGLADPVFLRDTLRQLLTLRAVERTVSEGEEERPALDLAEVRLTAMGRELFRQGKIEGEPEHPQLTLVFDVLTGEHEATPPKQGGGKNQENALSLLLGESWPEQCTNLSLERVRTYSQQRSERFHQGETRVRDAEVNPERGCFFEAEVRVTVSLDGEGRVLFSGALRPAQVASLKERAAAILQEVGLPPLPSQAQTMDAPVATAERLRDRAGLLLRRELVTAIPELVKQAKRDVVLHGYWQELAPLGQVIKPLVERGVHCVARSLRPSHIERWQDRGEQPPGFSVHAHCDDPAALPIAVVVDGELAIVAEPLSVVLPSGEPLPLVCAVRASKAQSAQLRTELLVDAAEELAHVGLGNSDVQGAQAALLLGASSKLTERLIPLLAPTAEAPLDRASSFKRIGRWMKDRALGSRVDWAARGKQALEEFFSGFVDPDPALVDAVIVVADGLVTADYLLERLIQDLEPVSVVLDPTPMARLHHIVRAMKTRSFGTEIARSALVRHFLDQCLELPSGAEPITEETVTQIVQVAGDERARRWASQFSGKWPPPRDWDGLLRWLQVHAPVQRLLGREFSGLATSFVQRVKKAQPEALDETSVLALRAAWRACGLPSAEQIGRSQSNDSKSGSADRPNGKSRSNGKPKRQSAKKGARS